MCGKGGGAAAVPFEDPLWNFKRGGGARPLRPPPLNPLVGMGSRDRPARSVPSTVSPADRGYTYISNSNIHKGNTLKCPIQTQYR